MFSFGSSPIASTPVLDRLRIELPIGAVAAPPIGRGSPTHMLPSYVTYFQRRTFWCWAAVAVSVARFYRPDADDVTQCRIVGRTLDRSGTVEGPADDPALRDVIGIRSVEARNAHGHGGPAPERPPLEVRDVARQHVGRRASADGRRRDGAYRELDTQSIENWR